MAAALARIGRWEPHAELLCWLLMPDHWHGLVRLTGVATLAHVVGAAKGGSAHAMRDVMAGRRVWAHGFHDCALRRDDDVLVAARYIIANPLRAGLVEHVGDYSLWDAAWL